MGKGHGSPDDVDIVVVVDVDVDIVVDVDVGVYVGVDDDVDDVVDFITYPRLGWICIRRIVGVKPEHVSGAIVPFRTFVYFISQWFFFHQ